MNRTIIASLLNNANHLDTLGFHREANTLTKLAQGYQREVGPPTLIQVGPRGSFDSNSMGNELDPRDRKGHEVIIVIQHDANATERRLDGFNNITHANNTAKKIARTTKEKYDFEPRVTLWSADPAYVKAHEMFMAGELDSLDLGTVRELRRDMLDASGAAPSPVRPAPPAPKKGGVYTLTFNYVDGKGWTVMMNEDGRIREMTPSGGKFKDSNHAVNYCKSIQRQRPEFKIINGFAEDATKKVREEARKKKEMEDGYGGDFDRRDRNM